MYRKVYATDGIATIIVPASAPAAGERSSSKSATTAAASARNSTDRKPISAGDCTKP